MVGVEMGDAAGAHEIKEVSHPTICLLGATGTGKSSTLNACFNTDKYTVGHLFVSQTVKPAAHLLPWRGTGTLMNGVDLCGFSDSEGRDSVMIDDLVTYLKDEVKHVNCFLLLLNSQEPRVGVHLKDMLLSIKTIFGGAAFMKNALIGFTRWQYTKKAKLMRRGVTKEKLAADVNALLREIVGHDHDCKCIYIDTTVNDYSSEQLQKMYGAELPVVLDAFHEAFNEIRDHALNNEPFSVSQIERTLAERDVGRDIIERQTAATNEGLTAFETLSAAWDLLDIGEPQVLLAELERAAQQKRDNLCQYLSEKVADLKDVMKLVLDTFDSDISAKIESVCTHNRNAAEKFDRDLRKRLVGDMNFFVLESIKQVSDNPHEHFRSICDQDRKIILQYVRESKGGSIAWGSFPILQEDLRFEQLSARDLIFGDSFKGKLPGIREVVNNPKGLLSFVGADNAPEWLSRLVGPTSRL